MGGIRVELKVNNRTCPVIEQANGTDASVAGVNRAVSSDGTRVVEEVVFEGGVDEDDLDLDLVYEHSQFSVFEFDRPMEKQCICDSIEAQLDRPISSIRSRGDSLYISLYVDDLDRLRDTVKSLRETCTSVGVNKINQSTPETIEDSVIIDRGELTARQMEVLQTAKEMGYLEHPKGANAGEVAEELGISVSTFSEHIAAVESKIMHHIVETD